MVKGDCPCGGEKCKEGFGWIWRTADLALNAHRGDTWAAPCPDWPDEQRVFVTEVERYLPPAPEGITMEQLLHYLKESRASRQASSGWVKSESAAERSKGGWN